MFSISNEILQLESAFGHLQRTLGKEQINGPFISLARYNLRALAAQVRHLENVLGAKNTSEEPAGGSVPAENTHICSKKQATCVKKVHMTEASYVRFQ